MSAAIIIYTDGGCWPNPGVGGWGAVTIFPDGSRIETHGGDKRTTNNCMELLGPIIALESLPATLDVPIVLHSDSRYVIDGISSWINRWKTNGWRSGVKRGRYGETAGYPVKNRELWERLDRARQVRPVTFRWVRGHAGIVDNERADELSKLGAVEANGGPIDFAAVEARFR